MKKIYLTNQVLGYKKFVFISIQLLFLTCILPAQNYLPSSQKCENCFSAKVTGHVLLDDCLSIDLQVFTSSSCNAALSHLMVEIPCGNVAEVTNSRDWAVEMSVTDPSTGLSGFKIDNIRDFGEESRKDSFQIS